MIGPHLHGDGFVHGRLTNGRVVLCYDDQPRHGYIDAGWKRTPEEFDLGPVSKVPADLLDALRVREAIGELRFEFYPIAVPKPIDWAAELARDQSTPTAGSSYDVIERGGLVVRVLDRAPIITRIGQPDRPSSKPRTFADVGLVFDVSRFMDFGRFTVPGSFRVDVVPPDPPSTIPPLSIQ